MKYIKCVPTMQNYEKYDIWHSQNLYEEEVQKANIYL